MNLFKSGFDWIVAQGKDGIGWLVKETVDGLLYGLGNFCRFMSTECFETFIIFALVGGLIYIGGGEKVGMKMIRISLVTFIIMQVVGVFYYLY